MGETGISSEFEYSTSFLRILIPGTIAVTLASFLLILFYPQYISFFKRAIGESVWAVLPIGSIYVFVSIFIGLMISVFNIPLTRILEGYYAFPFRDMFKGRQWEKLMGYIKDYESAEQDIIKRSLAYSKIYDYFSHYFYEITKNPQIEEDDLKKRIFPTKLGNVFKSIEVYPEWKYGMDGVFFWTRIQLLMSEENKKTIDKMRAFVDMFVELTWVFFIAAIAYLMVSAFNGKYVFSVVSLVILLLFSLVSYSMAVESTWKFGLYVRSIFDICREELWKKIKNKQFDKLSSLSEKERWNNIFRYLWHFNVIQCDKCGKFYDSKEKHICDS